MNEERVEKRGLSIVIENSAGSYRDFETEGDPIWNGYPLKGVTYPVQYGYIEGYTSEDGQDLDIFVGSGESDGYIVVRRLDVPLETKFFMNCTHDEIKKINEVFTQCFTIV